MKVSAIPLILIVACVLGSVYALDKFATLLSTVMHSLP